MILRRQGNKQKLAKAIVPLMPPHKIYIEPFFGAGGMFFNKPKAKHNIVNDLDDDVFNLFQVVIKDAKKLEDYFYKMPTHSSLLDYWKETKEVEPIQKALRFLLLSNLTFMGAGASIQGGTGNTKEAFYKNIDKTYEMINDVKFFNCDAVTFLSKKVAFGESAPIKDCFIYCDPPYLGTGDNYSDSYTEEMSAELFDCLVGIGCKFALSEFDHPYIIEQSKKHGLNVVYIGERANLKNRRTEILVTNYSNSQQSLF